MGKERRAARDDVSPHWQEAVAGGPNGIDDGGLEVLADSECLRLLESVPIGRIAFTADALPAVQPVNFVLHKGFVVFRTRPGSKLDTAMRNSVVAFEADDFDATTETGWSVTVVGRAEVVEDQAWLGELAELQLRPWAPGDRQHYVAISIGIMHGRRIADGESRSVSAS